MQIGYGVTYFNRELGNYPEIPVTNMIAEEIVGDEAPNLISRPGLAATGVEVGDGPIHAMYSKSGVFSGDVFSVSGDYFFRGTTSLGNIAGDGPFSIASYLDNVFVCNGSRLWVYNGTTLTEVTITDVPSISKVVVGMSRAIVIAGGTQTFYWSEPLATTIDVLAFAEAENSPDTLLDMLFLGDKLILFGTDTVEFWPSSTSSPDLPFLPLVGRTYQYGIKNMGASCIFGGSFAWVTDTNTICVDSPDQRISTRGIEELISSESEVFLWTFMMHGSEFLALRLTNKTLVFNLTTKMWSEFKSYGEDNWVPSCRTENTFGSSIDGNFIAWDYDSFEDLGTLLERKFRAGSYIPGSTIQVDNVVLRLNGGWTSFTTGDYANPAVEMRTSKDGGWTWSHWRQKRLGSQGNYAHQVFWNSCGVYKYPGFFAEFRVTDPVPFRVSYVGVNEQLV